MRFRSTAPSAPRRATAAVLAAALCFAVAAPARAQGLATVRDAEVEQLLRDYAEPIFEVAGIGARATRIILIGDRRFNAFVAGGRRIFINVGAVMESETPNQIIGVIAHEAGHIAGGHLARQREEVANAQVLAILGTLLGAVAAGSAMMGGGDQVGISGNPGAIVFGPQELVRRNLLSYQRGEEQAADRAALNYLEATGQSARGMIETFQRFANEQLFASSGADPYLQSHPMAPDRIANILESAERSPYFGREDKPALQERHDLARAKLFGFVARFDEVNRRYPLSDGSLPARYARAIADYRNGRLGEALEGVDGLIAARPRNPFFHELKGQILLESGRAAQAVAPLRRAVSLAPRQPLIRSLLGQALVATGTDENVRAAVKELRAVIGRDRDAVDAYPVLARAYGILGDTALADLTTAEWYAATGRTRDAVAIARRAQQRFKEGSPNWLRADDIAGMALRR
jgi:predicted Zn-dependent protease